MSRRARALALMLAAALGAAGCGASKPVRDLATVTAGNVSIVNTRLRAFARESEDVAAERYAIIRELDDRVTEVEKELRFKLQAMKLARETDKLQLYDQLDTFLKVLADLDRAVAERRAALQKQIAGSRSPLALPINPLTSVEGTLIDLGRPDSAAEMLAFYRTFIGEVVANMEKATASQGAAQARTVDGAKSAVAATKGDLATKESALKP